MAVTIDPGEPEVWCDTTDAVVDALAGGGSNQWRSRDGCTVDVSVSRLDGLLPFELAAFSDVAAFDRLTLGFPSPRSDASAHWARTRRLVVDLAAATDPVYGHGSNEDAGERLFSLGPVQAPLQEGRLPDVVPWWSLAPSPSPFAAALTELATALDLDVTFEGGVPSVVLDGLPWDEQRTAVAVASERWRTARP